MNSTELMPRNNIYAFDDLEEFNRVYKQTTGKYPEVISDYQCSPLNGIDDMEVCNFILVNGFDASAAHVAVLAHEVSHAVDAWFDYMGEDDPGTEIRAYAIQAAMLDCLAQLGVE